MKWHTTNATRAGHTVQEAATRRLARLGNVDKIGLSDRAARVAGSYGVQTVTAGRAYNQTRKKARGAATAVGNAIEQRPLLALLVTGAIGFMIGISRPRH